MSSEYYAEKFRKALLQASQDKQDPVSEWKLLDTTGYFETKCICTKDIFQVFYIQNKITGKILKIGCDCAERWLSCGLSCTRCNTALGNVMKRRREKDFLCRACKKVKKERDEYIFAFGKYYGLRWEVVASKQPYVDWLANLDEKTEFQKAFLSYCRDYYYNFEGAEDF